jgi:hypothetical protein
VPGFFLYLPSRSTPWKPPRFRVIARVPGP